MWGLVVVRVRGRADDGWKTGTTSRLKRKHDADA